MVPSAKNGDSRTKLSYTTIRLKKHTWYRSAIGIQEQHTMIGSFSIDNGEGSEHVTFKMNWRFFKLCRFLSNFLKMSNVAKFGWS